MIKVNLIFSLFVLFLANHTVAQKSRSEKRAARNEKINALSKQNEEGLIVFKKHLNYGAYLSTEGTHLFLEKGIRENRRITKLYKIELSEKKHQRENKSSNGLLNVGNPYTFAKLNNIYQLSMSYGVQYLIGSKGNKNGIEVTAVGTGGLILNFQKPYYFDAQDSSGNSVRVKFTNDTSTFKIFGGSGFSNGWNELKVNPGVFVRAGLRFEYGRDDQKVNAIEVGLQSEFFSKKVPQVFGIKEKNFFFGAYLGIVFGRRK